MKTTKHLALCFAAIVVAGVLPGCTTVVKEPETHTSTTTETTAVRHPVAPVSSTVESTTVRSY